MLNNMTIISAVETLPQSIQLLKSMAQILTKPEIKAFFGKTAGQDIHVMLCTKSPNDEYVDV